MSKTNYCPNCGAEQKGDEKFCSKCGHPLGASVSKENKSPKASKKNRGIIGAFHLSEDDFNFQVANHDVLSITKSSRGIATLTIIVLLIIGVAVIAFLNLIGATVPISYSDVLLTLVVYAPLLYFVYKGHLWAIVALALWYTFDKLYSTIIISPSHFSVGAIIFWIIGIAPLWIAFRVELAYRKKKKMATAVG